ncbi:MAG: hypothetical protein U0M42_09325 [Acutalibacteraceae bacterium]|nr:hypothetical protein [Acutalibacteraceae bacterium]
MNTPKEIYKEYEASRNIKNSLANKGFYEQNAINRRFYCGDQWYGANVGADRPLVRHNIIKRIGEYKMGELISDNVTVKYTAEGIAYLSKDNKDTLLLKSQMATGEYTFKENADDGEVRLLTDALSNYLAVINQKLHFESKTADILKNSFITGTGVLYTYWDNQADQNKGDICCEVLPVENIYFADYSEENLQKQPYIIIVTHCDTDSLKKTAATWGGQAEKITTDFHNSNKTAVYTKLFREADGNIYATCVSSTAVVRPPYNTFLSKYPLNLFQWEKKDGCILGDSEVTNLLGNQIAINRLLTASVWASMSMGMPIMTVNGDTVTGEITNDPGQIIKVYGTNEDVAGAIKFVAPPDFSKNFSTGISDLIANTLEGSGAGMTTLGKIGYNNTAAIESIAQVSGVSMASLVLRYRAFLEDVAILWLEFFRSKYGRRSILIEDENGQWYFPFDSSRYTHISFCAKAVKEENNESN